MATSTQCSFKTNIPYDLDPAERDIIVHYEIYEGERRTWGSPGYPPGVGVIDVEGDGFVLPAELRDALLSGECCEELERQARAARDAAVAVDAFTPWWERKDL